MPDQAPSLWRVTRVARFDQAQRIALVRPFSGLAVVMSGLRRWRLDGREVGVEAPALAVLVAGQVVDMAFDGARENWVVALADFTPRSGPALGQVTIAVAAGTVTLPLAMPLDPAELPPLRRQLRQMRDWLRSPDPASHWRCDLSAGQLFTRLLASGDAGVVEATPEERLRHLLDHERAFMTPITDLCRRCGASPDHLTRRFASRYGLPPARYREERRMALARDLLANGACAVKEVAARVGYASPAAFSTAFARICGEPPSAVIARQRRGTPGSDPS